MIYRPKMLKIKGEKSSQHIHTGLAPGKMHFFPIYRHLNWQKDETRGFHPSKPNAETDPSRAPQTRETAIREKFV